MICLSSKAYVRKIKLYVYEKKKNQINSEESSAPTKTNSL